jgi:hypothetical protein
MLRHGFASGGLCSAPTQCGILRRLRRRARPVLERATLFFRRSRRRSLARRRGFDLARLALSNGQKLSDALVELGHQCDELCVLCEGSVETSSVLSVLRERSIETRKHVAELRT